MTTVLNGLSESLDVLIESFFERSPSILTEFFQDFERSFDVENVINGNGVLDVLGERFVGVLLAEDGEDLVPGNRVGRSDQTLGFDRRKKKSSDVESGNVDDGYHID